LKKGKVNRSSLKQPDQQARHLELDVLTAQKGNCALDSRSPLDAKGEIDMAQSTIKGLPAIRKSPDFEAHVQVMPQQGSPSGPRKAATPAKGRIPSLTGLHPSFNRMNSALLTVGSA
jgi:hypothetical protein